MEILTAGEKQDHRLYVIRVGDVRFLVGAGIDFEQTLNYVPHGVELLSDLERAGSKQAGPQQQPLGNSRTQNIDGQRYLLGELRYDLSLYTAVDLASIDYILVSNLDNLYALPTLACGFKFEGTILMTQPVHQIGYQILKEFAALNEQRRQRTHTLDTTRVETHEDFPAGSNIWEDVELLDELEKEGKYITEWVSGFKQEDLDACWEKTRVLNYREELLVRSGVKITALSSGYHIGAAAFSLSMGPDKLLILNGHSYHRYRHCLPLDIRALKDHNKILLTDTFFRSDLVSPQNEAETRLNQAELSIHRFSTHLKRILKENKGQNILLPVRNIFFLLDILDILKDKVPGFRKIHVLTSTVEPIMKYSNASVDYLNKTLQAKIYQSKPELPFSFDKLFEDKRVEFFSDIHDFVELVKAKPNYLSDMTPSIFITVDSTFRLGYSGKLFEIMSGESGVGTIIFTDPYLQHSQVFAPLYHTNRLSIFNFPLNMHDSIVSTVSLLKKDVSDSKLIVPEKYVSVLQNSPLKDRLVVLKDNTAIELENSASDVVYCKPQSFAALKPKTIENLAGFKQVPEKQHELYLEVLQGSLSDTVGNNGQRTTLVVDEFKKDESPALMIVDRRKDPDPQDNLYELAKKLQEGGMQVFGVEKRSDELPTYVLRCGNSAVVHNIHRTEIYTDSDSEHRLISKHLKSCLGVNLVQ